MQATLQFRSTLFFIFALLLAAFCFAASTPLAHGTTATATPSLVQSTHNSTTGTATFSGAVTNGNTIIVGVTAWQATLSATAIKDNKGNTYTRLGEAVNGSDHAALYYAKNVAGGSSFTVTSSVGGTVAIFEYSGLSTTSPVENVASATGSSNTPKTSSVTTHSGSELYFALAWSDNSGDAWSAGPGYMLRQIETDNNSYERLATEDMVLANASTTNASFKTTTSSGWVAILATFIPAASGTTPPPPPPPPTVPVINSFTATPASITAGNASTLAWSVTGATSYSIDQGIGAVTGTSKSVSPTATTTYTLSAGNAAGTTTATVTVNVAPVQSTPLPKPAISSFTATPSSVTAGASSTLAWTITNASSTSIDNGVGTVTGTSVVVNPNATTTYTITATNPQGSVTAQVTVSVTPKAVVTKPAISSFTATPASITAGNSSTLAWNVTGATVLSIDQGVGTVTGTSKSVSPTATTTYTLSAGNSAGTTTASVTVNVAPVVVTPPSSNLVANGNFEAGTTNNPTNWTHDFWGSMTPTFTYPVTGNGGGKAVQIKVTGFSSGAANWIFPHMTDTGHDQYQYSEDYTSTVPHELDIEYLMKDGTFEYYWLQTVPASQSWRTITAQITPPINAASFTVLDGIGANGTLTIDNVSVTPLNDPFPNGMVTFTFDDGLLSQYQNAAPILKAAGLTAGFYIITTEPTSGDTGQMTWAQIKDLQSQGYEIGGHTRTHPFLTTLTTAQQVSEISGSYSDLLAQGITPQSFVYPYGDENPTIEAEVKSAGYTVARGSYTGENGTVSNRYALYDVRVDSTTNLTTLENQIAQAKADHRWLILELHDVLASGGDVDSITPSFFQSLVTYIKNSGIQVSTLQQGSAFLH